MGLADRVHEGVKGLQSLGAGREPVAPHLLVPAGDAASTPATLSEIDIRRAAVGVL